MGENFHSNTWARQYEFGDLKVDLNSYRIFRGSRTIDLSPTEFRLLCILMERPDHVFAREEIIGLLWPSRSIYNVRNVDVSVGRLRRALNRGNKERLIRTVRTIGYALH